MVGIALAIAIAALVLSVLALVAGLSAWVVYVGMHKSTHRIEYRDPALLWKETNLDTPEDKPQPEDFPDFENEPSLPPPHIIDELARRNKEKREQREERTLDDLYEPLG